MLFGLAMENPFQFSKAVVCCGVASSLPATAIRLEEPGEPIDLERARQQHAAYTEARKRPLQSLVVVELSDVWDGREPSLVPKLRAWERAPVRRKLRAW